MNELVKHVIDSITPVQDENGVVCSRVEVNRDALVELIYSLGMKEFEAIADKLANLGI